MSSVAPTQPMTQPETPKAGDSTVHVPTIITTADDFRQSRDSWLQRQYHVLTPIADFRALPPHYGLLPAQVKINPDQAVGDVYQDGIFTKGEEFALTKLGLNKIALAAGMTIRTERTSPHALQHYWEVKATATFIGIDGTPQSMDATEEFDLREGSERAMGAQPRQLKNQREKGLRHCESRAINAAIRNFGLKHKYTRKELEKPFVVLRVHFIPDMNDPETRRFITERALQGTTMLYSGSPAARALPEPEHLDTIGAGADVADPPTTKVGTLLVVDVIPKSGTTNGRPWTVFRVSFSDGRFGGTFDTNLFDKAIKARNDKIPVRRIVIDESGKNPTLTTLELSTEPEDVPLPMDMPDLDEAPKDMKL